ncbi:MAG: sigma-54-dependent Fis family transcriptional regulator [FCB group bacterium]|nr:sigma-54-dependent Fis family transcriptional regulator [FCB group bacterium]MBL7029477.1 sigma-54-dependent Fis family transcriptional regulator [Candidatus Neomarinimicrobiota bacterium]MBL7123074.1 sigma-54-dependent Fis family transcriptional regulator [Candidatus Neomarinimicrobiota bacterium]
MNSAHEFLMLNPRRRKDPQSEKVLLEHLKKYGQVTQTSDWVSLFNYVSIHAYSAIFISCAAFADEHPLWNNDLRRVHPHQPIILFSARQDFDVRIAGETSKLFGVVRIDDIETSLQTIMEQLDKYTEFSISLGSKTSKKLLRPGGFGDFVGNSLPMLDVYRQLTRVAASEYTVLIQGESGSGKELVARTIHQLSERRTKPFVSINCAAIPENLLESELFGFEKGAFTGANQDKAGKFELANDGTLFLDEIGDMPLELQVKLLRVLEDGKIQPLGSVREKSVNIRLVTATHKNLPEQITKGLFREDLHYRLNVIPLKLPPLRSRTSDLTLLVLFYLEKLLRGEDQTIKRVSWDLIESFANMDLHGNVRELENMLTRSVFQSDGELLSHSSLNQEDTTESHSATDTVKAIAELTIRPLWEIEKDALQFTLTRLNGNISQAASQLQISRTAIYRKIKKYKLNFSDNSATPGGDDA